MSVPPLVSVIVTCHNYERWLPDCIKSIRAGSYQNIEIILVHDGCAITEGNYGEDETIRMAKNAGVAAARNEGLTESCGNYIWFVDADDMAMPDSIKDRVDHLEAHPELDMVHGVAKKINVKWGNWNWPYEKCWNKMRSLETYARPMNNGTLLWRRRVFEKYGGYYEGLRSKEDKELTYRFGVHRDSPFNRGLKHERLNRFIFIYRRHPNSKHKMRCADKAWAAETDRLFDQRIKQLKKEGITTANTRFPI